MTTKWTDELVKSELSAVMQTLNIKRMPTSNELKSLGRNDLHCKISKTKKYSGWAKELGLSLKMSETTFGNSYELHVMKKIQYMYGLSVRKMTTRHPYDLLVNDCIKIDVKVGRAHRHFEARAHTFALNKKYATCDIYVCVALDENEQIERYFVIPACHVQIVTLNIGKESKYNDYVDNWMCIKRLVGFYEKAVK